jgi:hypothetical protein
MDLFVRKRCGALRRSLVAKTCSTRGDFVA